MLGVLAALTTSPPNTADLLFKSAPQDQSTETQDDPSAGNSDDHGVMVLVDHPGSGWSGSSVVARIAIGFVGHQPSPRRSAKLLDGLATLPDFSHHALERLSSKWSFGAKPLGLGLAILFVGRRTLYHP